MRGPFQQGLAAEGERNVLQQQERGCHARPWFGEVSALVFRACREKTDRLFLWKFSVQRGSHAHRFSRIQRT